MKQNTECVVVHIDVSPISDEAACEIETSVNPVRLFVNLWTKYLALRMSVSRSSAKEGCISICLLAAAASDAQCARGTESLVIYLMM